VAHAGTVVLAHEAAGLMPCQRCHGLLVAADLFDGIGSATARRCLACGDLTDPLILQHRACRAVVRHAGRVTRGWQFHHSGLAIPVLGGSKKERTERLLGTMLKETTRATGGDAQRTRFQKGRESPLTIKQLGLDYKTSMLARRVASLSQEKFKEVQPGGPVAGIVHRSDGQYH